MPGVSGISFHQTEPIQGNNSGTVWTEGGEGSQYLSQGPLFQGSTQSEYQDSFGPFPASQVHTPRSTWNIELSPTTNGEEMSRFPSQDSIGAHSHRTSHSSLSSNPYEQNGSVGMYHSISQMPFHMSSGRSDGTGRSNSPDNSALYTPTQPMDLQSFESFSFPAGEDIPASDTLFHRNSEVSCASEQPFGLYTSTADDTFESPLTVGHLPIAQDRVYNHGLIIDSPILWDNGPNLLDSQRSSPVLDEWALPTSQLITSTSSSPLDYSPSLGGVSPTCLPEPSDIKELPPYPSGSKPSRKPVGPRQSKVAGDMASRNRAPTGTSEASDESMRFVVRSSLELDNSARDHPLYHNAAPKDDGLYHCPWESDPTCQHKPEKLKCNYEYECSPLLLPSQDANHIAPVSKFVDSHLKPYRCKVVSCEASRFSSTACLLRHEREAHAMHGHGDKPYLCTYEGCDRSLSGNGFPRHWNLRDHMRRVHNDPGPTKSSTSGSPPPSNGPVRGRNKRKAEASDATAVEKPLKRIATPPVVARQPFEPSLVDRYLSSEQRLLETVKQLHDPTNSSNMTLLRNASNCIKVMAQTTQRINSAPAIKREFSQQSSG
jgi:hypothetical protein